MLTHHVKHYLNFIGSEKQLNTFCWMNGNTSKVITGRSTVFGKFKDIGKWEKELGREGVKLPTLHMTLNETDLEGRRRGNIKAYRVLCCDLDRPVEEKELILLYKKYSVHLVVQSSPKKYHLYWKLERGSDLDTWVKLQLGIASKLNGDLQLSLPTSMIRVPGFTRLAKDEKKIMPSIMTFEEENKVKELRLKKLVKMWPWIWEEAEKGEEKLKKERKEAARIARELMKARGKEYDSAKFARMTPDAGRNNTLYLTIYDIVYSSEEAVSYSEAVSFGRELNQSFHTPLEDSEAEKTVRSARTHGLRARKKKVREKLKLLETLSKNAAGNAAKEKKKKKAQKKELNKLMVQTFLGPDQQVPESYLEISNLLVDRLWTREDLEEKEQIATHNTLVSAQKFKYYKKLTDFLVLALKTTGAFKVSGYSVYLRGTNEAGEAVRYRKNLDSDSLSALVLDILSRLYLYAVKVSLNGKKEVKGENLISYLEQGNGRKTSKKVKEKKKKNGKNKAKGNSKIHRDKTNGRSDSKKNTSGTSTANAVT